MVDVERELGSLFEKLDQERKTKAEEYQKTEQRMKIEFDEFKGVDDRITPVMLEYQKYLQKKDINSDIVRVPKHGSASLRKPSISFVLTDSSLTSRLGVYPSIKYSLEGEKISETIQAKTNISVEYSKDQITEEFVATKLTNLIKSCYNKEIK